VSRVPRLGGEGGQLSSRRGWGWEVSRWEHTGASLFGMDGFDVRHLAGSQSEVNVSVVMLCVWIGWLQCKRINC